ncbi:MAG: fumarylacetoacetate hydrolase family protein [Rhodospirillales bacterium]|nr:fumarylacetoacetate hydrolase family protein [Rhodospirillales bacterium]
MTDENDRSLRAARLIWDCWQAGTTMVRLPTELRPRTRAEGYAIQAHYAQFSGLPLFGWKIAATSAAGQNHIGVSGPMAGRLLQERVFQPGQVLEFGSNRMAVAEAEFAFCLGRTLTPQAAEYDLAEVMTAVDTLHTGMEFPDSRFEDFARVGEEQLIADNACSHQFVIGPAMPDSWRSIDLSQHAVTIGVSGGQSHAGSGANVLGDPKIALTWLVNELSRHGISLEAGAIVTTGTCTTPIAIAASDTVTADYGALGRLQATFTQV